MARSYATVGQMLTYAVERTVNAPESAERTERPVRADAILRHMLEFVLMAPRSRRAFLRTVLRTERATGSIVAAPRLHRHSPDLVAEILPSSPESDDGARFGIVVSTEGLLRTTQLEKHLAALGTSEHHLLLAVSRRSDLVGGEEQLPERVQATSWRSLARRMSKADPGHQALWETIGEIGENSGRPIVQYPVEAKRLLTKKSVAQEFRGHLDVMHRASRDLLGTSPHFSTRRGQTDAHLQAGVRLHRTGLEFGEVEQGTPVHLQRAGHEPVPLGIGLPRTDEESAEAAERLESLARRTAWRTDEGALPATPELIGAPASPEVEGARLLLWAVLNPMLLRDRGFDLAPARRQPALTATTMGLRLLHRGDETGTTYRLWVGGERDWTHLIPKVTREATADRPEETYAVAPRKSQSTADFVWEVHRALRSLTIV
ncbi:hypothetical protein ACTXMW_04130 [Brachybacterium paraconglomeratum]|uniref:hypothetical protein n=1 Tax=Brachybacterium paraconglomeratum TaxID=173362 RepID=UPI003FD23A43